MGSASTRRAVGIVRVSQRDDDAVSPEVQARAMLKQAADEGFSLAADDIWDENLDGNGRIRPASAGAALADRPKLLAAIEEVERGRAEVIVAERFDRLFRDLDVQREVIRRVEAAGGRLVTAAGQITHATAEAELHANLNGAIGQYTRRTAMERSWDAVEIAIEEGRIPWKDTTPGYDLGEDGKLTPNEDAPVVARAVEMRANGATIATIRAYLAEHGIVRSYHGTQHLLRSALLVGEIHFGAHTPNLKAHDAIVDREVWKRAQRVKVSRGRKPKSERLLARLGVLRCANCGGRMVVGMQTQNGRAYPFYRCGRVREDCDQRVTISAEKVEDLVVDKVRRALADAEGRASVEQNARAAAARAAAAQDALDAAVRSFEAAGVMDEASAVERLSGLRAERDAARERVEQLGGQRAAVTVSAAADWDRLTLDAQRGLIRATVDRVEVSPYVLREPTWRRVRVHLVGA